jgi:hypothetical protein
MPDSLNTAPIVLHTVRLLELDTTCRRQVADVMYQDDVEIERERSKNSRKITHANDDQSKVNIAWV